MASTRADFWHTKLSRMFQIRRADSLGGGALIGLFPPCSGVCASAGKIKSYSTDLDYEWSLPRLVPRARRERKSREKMPNLRFCNKTQ